MGQNPSRDQPQYYLIRIQGQLHDRWATSFGDLTLSIQDDGTTILRGPIADQAALHGALRRIRDLGMAIIAVQRLDNTEGSVRAPFACCHAKRR